MTEPKRGIDLSSAVIAGADGPAPVAGEGALVKVVAAAIAGVDGEIDHDPEAKAAILAVADWIQANAAKGEEGCDWWVASKLRREVEL